MDHRLSEPAAATNFARVGRPAIRRTPNYQGCGCSDYLAHHPLKIGGASRACCWSRAPTPRQGRCPAVAARGDFSRQAPTLECAAGDASRYRLRHWHCCRNAKHYSLVRHGGQRARHCPSNRQPVARCQPARRRCRGRAWASSTRRLARSGPCRKSWLKSALQTRGFLRLSAPHRGPFGRGRIIDLSRVAADQLGMRHEGVVRVRLELDGLAGEGCPFQQARSG
jgi:hypothetical protein